MVAVTAATFCHVPSPTHCYYSNDYMKFIYMIEKILCVLYQAIIITNLLYIISECTIIISTLNT